MSGIAFVLLNRGFRVTGSDLKESKLIRKLKALGAKVYIGHDKKNIDKSTDLVVISSAIPENNPEIVQARKFGIPIKKRSEILGELMRDKFGVAIAGTHGKTTTTTMISLICDEAKFDPTVLIGGEVKNIGGNFSVGGGDYFIVEACEYDRSFLDLFPKAAVITNIEADHLDYYRDLKEIVAAFSEFVRKIPKEGLLVACFDDPNVKKVARSARAKVISYGFSKGCDWQAEIQEVLPGKTTFIIHNHKDLGRFTLKIPGTHNILDATAAVALTMAIGVSPAIAKKVLAKFAGADRRFQIKGKKDGVVVIDDYAHHPTEIRATLAGARQFYPRERIVCVFEPHQYSRTRLLLSEFAQSFNDADLVIIPDIYRVRDSDEEIKKINAKILVENIKKYNPNVRYIAKYDEIVKFLQQELKPGDVLFTMGAGNIYKVGEKILLE